VSFPPEILETDASDPWALLRPLLLVHDAVLTLSSTEQLYTSMVGDH